MDELIDERILRVLERLAAGGPTARLVLDNALSQEFRGEPADLETLRRRLGLESPNTAPVPLLRA